MFVKKTSESIHSELFKSCFNVFMLFMQPKVVTATDEAELARQMEKAEQENAEVAGDDDEEEIEGQVFSAGEEGEDGENGEAGSGEED